MLLEQLLQLPRLVHYREMSTLSDRLLQGLLPRRISHPPTNSPLTYICGIVGHSLGTGTGVRRDNIESL